MRRLRAQSASELTLVISVVVLAVLAASTTMVPLFGNGVNDLGGDVRNILADGSVGGVGGTRGGSGNGGTANRGFDGSMPHHTGTVTPEDVVISTAIMNGSAAESWLVLGPPS